MHNIQLQAAIATTSDCIPASQITSGDIILHHGSQILVMSEPEYTIAGLVFDALWLDIGTPDNTHWLCFQPEELLELVSHTPLFSDAELAV